jgi:predicted nucleic acid-binding protein
VSEPAGLLDTSVFIAREADRPLDVLPARVTVSVVTIGELELGDALIAATIGSVATITGTVPGSK